MVKIERAIRALSCLPGRTPAAGARRSGWLIPRERVSKLLGYRTEMGFKWFLKRFKIKDEDGHLRADEVLAALEKWREQRQSEQSFAKRFDARHGAGAYQKLREMLRANDLTFAEIGRVLGLSRERVRQIALKRFGISGRKRQAVSAMTRQEEKLIKRFYSQNPWFNDMLQTLQRFGSKVEIVGTNLIVVNGQCKVQLREAEFKRRSLGGGSRSYYIHMSIRSAHDADFLLLRARWHKRVFYYVLPSEVLPSAQVVLPLPLRKSWRAGRRMRVIPPERSKYFQYLEAWHLLGRRAKAKAQAAGLGEPATVRKTHMAKEHLAATSRLRQHVNAA